ncbi:receptor-type tyrosine-protein phosphatase eta [Osmerus mordax]|uniref:receptor-type tyrosine-protein phosphatase eta n=1 Tax=Osmerus mordax TaxID=8014 RepID=UPI00350F9A63
MNETTTQTDFTVANLIPGVKYTFAVTTVAGDNKTESKSVGKSFFTKPDIIRNFTVFNVTTSSVVLNWDEPVGNWSFYRVEWNDGSTSMKSMNETTTQTDFTVANLIPGVKYTFAVTTVAGDNKTESMSVGKSFFTKPDIIRNFTVFNITTSSVVLNWAEPVGNWSFYRVEWNDGSTSMKSMNGTTTQTDFTVENLIPGVKYTFAVTTVAGDLTKGKPSVTSVYTKPDVVMAPVITSSKDSLHLNWAKPSGQTAGYKVLWNNVSLFTQAVSANITGLIPGTHYTVKIIALAQDNITQGAPYTRALYTNPDDVTNLFVSNVTTSSVWLNWNSSLERSFFRVEWTSGNKTGQKNTSETSVSISGLVAGFKYTFKVTAVAGNNITEGNSGTTTSFVKPERPANISVVGRGTSYLYVEWILPAGRVDVFTVSLSNEDLKPMTTNQNISNVKKEANFTDLQPGRLYLLTVTSIAGSFSSQTDGDQIATVPSPPGAILLLSKTSTSLTVQWALPVSMETAPNITYNITYQSSSNIQSVSSKNNSYVLSGLASGTLYNITVVTVGPQGFTSTPVQNSSFTLPNPVLSLRATLKNTSSVVLVWDLPLSAQSYYTYRVQILNKPNASFTSVSNTTFLVHDLEPGTGYNFTVTTVAGQDSEATPQLLFSYTKPMAVTNLTVVESNTTIRLSWYQQGDHKPSYSYLVNINGTSVNRSLNTTVENYLLTDLVPGSPYTIAVVVVVKTVMSDPTTTNSYTYPGIVTGIVAIGTTTNLSVTWLRPTGQVESYMVQLDHEGVTENTTLIQTNNYLFENLIPGQLYTVTVFTQSGPHRQVSAAVQNATFPNPPGSVITVEPTTSSINISWTRPDQMVAERYNFSVQINSSTKTSTKNWFQFLKLKSGTLYSISVTTVGALGYESSMLTKAISTKPYPVSNLTANSVNITTVFLTWDQTESQQGYIYQVETVNSNGSSFISHNVTATTIIIPELQSGSAYTSTVTTTTQDSTMATPVKVSYFTRPFNINNLTATTLNTTAVNLTWDKPLEYQSSYTYRITILGCVSAPKNYTVTREGDVVVDLLPGTNCTFSVSVITRNATEGDAVLTYQYTSKTVLTYQYTSKTVLTYQYTSKTVLSYQYTSKTVLSFPVFNPSTSVYLRSWAALGREPEVVQLNISNTGSNSSVRVSWSPPPGGVEQYVVVLSTDRGPPLRESLNSSSTFRNFYELNPATEYNATVTTISGPFNATSGPVTTATFPNPPGPISILTKTTSSLSLRWEEAPLMSNSSFKYIVTYTSPGNGEKSVTTANQTTNLTGLESGTPYTVSVVTLGPLIFRSKAVQMKVTTRPERISGLNVTEIDEKKVTLQWMRPTGDKPGYKYAVNWTLSTEPKETSDTTTVITGLVPGTNYTFMVTTQTADGTEGAPVSITRCTKASPVFNLTCEGPNSPEAWLNMSWSPPAGNMIGLTVNISKDNSQINSFNPGVQCNQMCTYSVSNLSHYTEYKVAVQTLACGPPSEIRYCTKTTGITSPPIPANASNLVHITKTQHDSFTVQVNPSLLDNRNGPITTWGVLVTSDTSNPVTNLSVYLNKTYKDSDKAYLATVQNISRSSRSGGDYLTLDIGDGTSYQGYSNPALKPLHTYRYAIVLFTLLEIQPRSDLVNVATSFFTVTEWYHTDPLPQSPVVIGIAVGASLGVFAVLFIILIGFVVYWMRQRQKDNSDIQIHSLRAKVSVAVKVEDYEAYYKKQKADSNCGFAEEFEELKPVGTVQAKNSALAVENKPKNRYNNVLPYDSSRVRLSTQGSGFDDYINANYIPGYNSRKEFIAAQGPLPVTVDQFWRMIWEKNVLTLVMLTRCNEQGRVKCEEYWPADTKHFENITVTTTSELPLEDWTIREFDVKNVKTAETRSVRHFHFTAWPDHGVPETTELLINFRHLVREHMDQFSRHSPTIVHCSAGVGRTGTFIAIDRLLFQIERDSMVDVYGTIHDLRMHRPLMVQTEDQYVFLNQCAVDIIRSRTGTNVDLIYQNTAALTIYENVEPKKNPDKNGYHNA